MVVGMPGHPAMPASTQEEMEAAQRLQVATHTGAIDVVAQKPDTASH